MSNLKEKLLAIFEEEKTIMEDRGYPDTRQFVSDFLTSQGIEADFDVEEGALELSDGGTPYRYDVIRFKDVPVVVTLLLNHCIGWDYVVSGVDTPSELTPEQEEKKRAIIAHLKNLGDPREIGSGGRDWAETKEALVDELEAAGIDLTEIEVFVEKRGELTEGDAGFPTRVDTIRFVELGLYVDVEAIHHHGWDFYLYGIRDGVAEIL